jgi:hypothetical protein
MRFPAVRFTIGRSMVVIAVVAFLLSLPTAAVEFLLLFMTIPALILVPASLAPSGRRIEAAYWAMTIHPLVFLAWLAAWRSLGIRQPLRATDKYVIILEIPYVLAYLSRFYLPILAAFGLTSAAYRFPRLSLSTPLLFVPIVWLTTLVVLMRDPFELAVWVWD